MGNFMPVATADEQSGESVVNTNQESKKAELEKYIAKMEDELKIEVSALREK